MVVDILLVERYFGSFFEEEKLSWSKGKDKLKVKVLLITSVVPSVHRTGINGSRQCAL